ncbi:MAG: class I SAM-dependent methyltransferase [Acidobacteria bacterium]|nr:class I SAM-dependent methyltransferase [Acidobacteriota bacterium]
MRLEKTSDRDFNKPESDNGGVRRIEAAGGKLGIAPCLPAGTAFYAGRGNGNSVDCNAGQAKAEAMICSSEPQDAVCRRVIKLPPQGLREKKIKPSDAAEYLKVGVRSASTIFHFLRGNGYHLGSFERILDFACGCGRTLNFMPPYVRGARLYGCDCEAELVAWCQRNLQVYECILNQTSPTPFPDAHFDLIYSFAFFTNLDEGAQEKWLKEWRRIVKDDGFILVSLRGPKAARCRGVSIPRRGFVHINQGCGFNQQQSYQTREYVELEWTRWFKILDFQEQGLLNSHDLVLLGTPRSELRQRQILPLSFPPELVQEYEHCSDLQFVFDESGLGRPRRGWRNLSLADWAMTNGAYDVPSLDHLGFYSLFRVVETL